MTELELSMYVFVIFFLLAIVGFVVYVIAELYFALKKRKES